MKILFHYDAGPSLRQSLASHCSQDVSIVCCPEGPGEPFRSELPDADVIWHVLHPIDSEVIRRAPRLKLIQKIGVGVNTIDLEAARARGVAVCNMPGTNSRAVAEHTLLLMLSALRRLPAVDSACRGGHWAPDEKSRESFGEISGRTVGIVGYGAVPAILAPILDALGARVIYTSRSRKPVPWAYHSLPELLACSDLVSLHVPLTDETQGMLDAAAIRSMKKGAVLINTARGELVDETALYDALDNDHLSAAGLDVFAQEPVAADNPLLSLATVTVTPHIGWLTQETFERSIDIALRNSHAASGSGDYIHRVV